MVDFCKVKIVTDVEKFSFSNFSSREITKLGKCFFKYQIQKNSEYSI